MPTESLHALPKCLGTVLAATGVTWAYRILAKLVSLLVVNSVVGLRVSETEEEGYKVA